MESYPGRLRPREGRRATREVCEQLFEHRGTTRRKDLPSPMELCLESKGHGVRYLPVT